MMVLLVKHSSAHRIIIIDLPRGVKTYLARGQVYIFEAKPTFAGQLVSVLSFITPRYLIAKPIFVLEQPQ
ncbi:hypothetical protein C5Y96_02445 [Blastopirellula marina]|uniref:Uncharacterized protein n=1 Tax=Blastopirellula marina TaxID=124 RepID=A0A2S8G394_9BACT|nr:hypothetical protein C5Y96_02445 [Blastopirellula marina]RCS55068.1 hypothetical protein DTL36_02450 [Bremerella cremea]